VVTTLAVQAVVVISVATTAVVNAMAKVAVVDADVATINPAMILKHVLSTSHA
jgi:hypothetical protein